MNKHSSRSPSFTSSSQTKTFTFVSYTHHTEPSNLFAFLILVFYIFMLIFFLQLILMSHTYSCNMILYIHSNDDNSSPNQQLRTINLLVWLRRLSRSGQIKMCRGIYGYTLRKLRCGLMKAMKVPSKPFISRQQKQ